VVPALALLVIFSVLVLVRQALSPEARTQRFYTRIRQQPESTLELLDTEYSRTHGAPGLLLNLANRSRSEQNMALANLADGLFLLTARPDAALAIINGALENAHQQQLPW